MARAKIKACLIPAQSTIKCLIFLAAQEKATKRKQKTHYSKYKITVSLMNYTLYPCMVWQIVQDDPLYRFDSERSGVSCCLPTTTWIDSVVVKVTVDDEGKDLPLICFKIHCFISCRPVEAVLWRLYEDWNAQLQEIHHIEAGITIPWNR